MVNTVKCEQYFPNPEKKKIFSNEWNTILGYWIMTSLKHESTGFVLCFPHRHRFHNPRDHLSLKHSSMALTCPPPKLASSCLSFDVVPPPWIDYVGLLSFWFPHISDISREAEEWGSPSSTQASQCDDWLVFFLHFISEPLPVLLWSLSLVSEKSFGFKTLKWL